MRSGRCRGSKRGRPRVPISLAGGETVCHNPASQTAGFQPGEPMSHLRLVATTLLVVLCSVPVFANHDLIISEYIEGSSNNKAIEIYNPTAATINLATNNYVLQM